MGAKMPIPPDFNERPADPFRERAQMGRRVICARGPGINFVLSGPRAGVVMISQIANTWYDRGAGSRMIYRARIVSAVFQDWHHLLDAGNVRAADGNRSDIAIARP